MTRIDIDPRRPRFRGPLALWRQVARSLGLHNTTTREALIRRYLSVDRGRPCTEFRRSESERLLRAQPFLATASVRPVPDGPGRVRIEVETTDEVPALVAARYRSRDWAVSLGNENTFGTGARVMLHAEQRDHYGGGYGATLIHRQVLGRPYVLAIDARKHPIGQRWTAELGHAFLTDLQRIAWHTGMTRRDDYVRLRPGADADGGSLALPLEQRTWDAGGVVRFGPPGRTLLVGGVLAGERITPAVRPVVITDSGFTPASGADSVAASRFTSAQGIRANLVAGIRAIRYVQGRGLDALTATQDLANGVQVSTIVGKSLDWWSDDDDGFLAANLFVGYGGPRSYAALQVEGEARRDFGETAEWDGILGSSRAAWYVKPSRVLTTIASVEWAGGWRERFPFLLEIGDREGGVRGFGSAEFAGARRTVARLEQRWVAGPVRGRGDLGFALFADAGRVWAGDAPFGVTSPVVSSVGISVLAAVPTGGQRLFRMDVAFPVRGRSSGGVELRFSMDDPTGHFWETPDDVRRARAAAVPQRIFAWP